MIITTTIILGIFLIAQSFTTNIGVYAEKSDEDYVEDVQAFSEGKKISELLNRFMNLCVQYMVQSQSQTAYDSCTEWMKEYVEQTKPLAVKANEIMDNAIGSSLTHN